MHVAGHSVRDCVDYIRESARHNVTRVQSCRLTGASAHTRTVSALCVAHRSTKPANKSDIPYYTKSRDM